MPRSSFHCVPGFLLSFGRPQNLIGNVFFVCLMICLPAGVSAQQTVSIPQVPLAVQDGSAHYLGHFNPQQMLRLAVALKPPHVDEEEQFLRELQDPASPQFHKYLS
jgi:hypothetical protein